MTAGRRRRVAVCSAWRWRQRPWEATIETRIERFEALEVALTAARVYGRGLGVFLGLSLLGALPAWVVHGFAQSAGLVPAVFEGQPPAAPPGTPLLALVFAQAAALSLGAYWAHGAAAYFVVRALRSGPPTFLETVAQAFRRSAYVLVAAFLLNVTVTLGLLLLVVPGIAIWLMFWVATPAAMVEGRFASALRRSHSLTAGHRWALLALLVLLLLAMVPIVIAITVAVAATSPLVLPYAMAFVQVAAWAAWGVAAAVSYYRLRTLAEAGQGRAGE